MPKHNGCQARQYSDQMYCPKCRITWDVSDPDPPECPGRMAREAAKLLRENLVPPNVVKTKQDAQELTKRDPSGRVWRVGERYYLAVMKSHRFPVLAD